MVFRSRRILPERFLYGPLEDTLPDTGFLDAPGHLLYHSELLRLGHHREFPRALPHVDRLPERSLFGTDLVSGDQRLVQSLDPDPIHLPQKWLERDEGAQACVEY